MKLDILSVDVKETHMGKFVRIHVGEFMFFDSPKLADVAYV